MPRTLSTTKGVICSSPNPHRLWGPYSLLPNSFRVSMGPKGTTALCWATRTSKNKNTCSLTSIPPYNKGTAYMSHPSHAAPFVEAFLFKFTTQSPLFWEVKRFKARCLKNFDLYVKCFWDVKNQIGPQNDDTRGCKEKIRTLQVSFFLDEHFASELI